VGAPIKNNLTALSLDPAVFPIQELDVIISAQLLFQPFEESLALNQSLPDFSVPC
jgi:hypothetical protein